MVDAVTSALWVLIPTTVAVQVDIHYTWVESPASIQLCVMPVCWAVNKDVL